MRATLTNHFPHSSEAVVVAGAEPEEHEQEHEQEHEGGRPKGRTMSGVMTANMLSGEERREFLVCERDIESGFRKAAEALATVRDRRLYREEFDSFEAYIKGRRTMGVRHAHRLCNAFSVIQNLLEDPAVHIYSAAGVERTVAPLALALPSSEGVARPLAALEPDEQRAVWAEATAAVPGGKPTVRDVEAVIERRRPGKKSEQEQEQEQERKWPEANEYGVYDDLGCERIEYKSNNASAAIRLLQVGGHDWAVGYKYLYEIGNRTGSAIGILNRRLFSARDDGLRYGAEMIAAGQRTIMQAIETTITPAQKAEANKLFKWATGQMRDPAPAPVRQEIKLAESKGAKVDPAVKKLAAKIYGIGIAHFEQARAWDELKNHSKEGWFAIARWHLSEIKSLAEVVKEEAAAIVKEEWHRNGNGARKAAWAKQEAGRRRKAAVKRGRRPEGRTTNLRRRR